MRVWFDGACPICTREIALMRRLDRAGRIDFIDASSAGGGECPLDRALLLERFHAQEQGGPIVSGAAAFAAMWRAIPLLRPIGLLAKFPPALACLELFYRAFLKIRPALTRRLQRAADPG